MTWSLLLGLKHAVWLVKLIGDMQSVAWIGLFGAFGMLAPVRERGCSMTASADVDPTATGGPSDLVAVALLSLGGLLLSVVLICLGLDPAG